MILKTNELPKWVRYRAAGYLRGKGLSLGVPSLIDKQSLFPILAHEGSAFELSVGAPYSPSMVTGDDLSIFTKESFDHVVTYSNHPKTNELITKLKVGGHFISIGDNTIVVPSGVWQIKPGHVIDNISVSIFKKLSGKDDIVKPYNPVKSKRACIARYGAIGDALQLTPIIHQLHDDGYEVTLNISPYTAEVYKYNPYVTNIINQERNVIPNQDLGEYWDYWKGQYDLYINLSESIEGKLLKVEGRSEFYAPSDWRRQHCDINYHDQHMLLSGLDHSKYELPELYFSQSEIKDIQYELRPLKDKFNIVWSLKGSSNHKIYPFFEEVARTWLQNHPDTYILTLGGPESKALQIEHERVIPLAGLWPLRKSLIITKYCDLVIGPESAIVNAASCFDTPKICLLSHSSKNNLTKYWTNNYSIEPDKSISPCYPCHQLHYSLESCPLVDLEIDKRKVENLPRCTTAINPSTLYNTIDLVYTKWLNLKN